MVTEPAIEDAAKACMVTCKTQAWLSLRRGMPTAVPAADTSACTSALAPSNTNSASMAESLRVGRAARLTSKKETPILLYLLLARCSECTGLDWTLQGT